MSSADLPGVDRRGVDRRGVDRLGVDRLGGAVAGALPHLDGAPGAVVAVTREDGTVAAAAGVADLATGEELTAGHAFRTASVTKLATAALALRLA
ncbi:MAG TPA: serine hydrolase, partial [Pseudonocardia sp.]|nr:serine hydrolase [Pseudonocardia sp.]